MNDPQPEGHMASHIGRRKFLATLLGSAAAWPLAARAQQGDRVRLLVAMMGGRNADTDPEGRAWFVAFRQALQELGWVEGRNFRADYRWPSGDLDRMRAIAKEFVDLKPDVMFAGNTPSVVALLRETHTIPIVFTNLSDPVGTGVVGGLALLWQILSGTGFPNQFFCDSWVVGFGGADHGWKDVGLERRAWTLSQAVSGSVGSQGAATNVSTLRVGADRSWRS